MVVDMLKLGKQVEKKNILNWKYLKRVGFRIKLFKTRQFLNCNFLVV